MQSYVVFANVDAFEAAGVEVPTGETLAWDDFEALAAELTTDDGFGLGWGLRSPTATIMNLALGFGGDFFTVDGRGRHVRGRRRRDGGAAPDPRPRLRGRRPSIPCR